MITFVSSVLSNVSHELQNLFSKFEVVRNYVFEKTFETVAQKLAIQCGESRYKIFVHLFLELLADAFLMCLRILDLATARKPS